MRLLRHFSHRPASAVAVEGEGTVEIFEAQGCTRCAVPGYRGRIGLFEVMTTVSDEIRKLIIESASADQIAAVAVEQGMRRLREDGLAKVQAGETTLAEVARVTGR